MNNRILKFKNTIKNNEVYICSQWDYKDAVEAYNNRIFCNDEEFYSDTTETQEFINMILKNNLIPQTIIINIRKQDNQDYINYNEGNKELEIETNKDNVYIEIVDGIKKIIAVNLAKEQKTELKGSFIVKIINLDEKNAFQYVNREKWSKSMSIEPKNNCFKLK